LPQKPRLDGEAARFVDWYNRERKHSTCEMLSPIDYEAIIAEKVDAA
jgi:transposase InsO family protein